MLKEALDFVHTNIVHIGYWVAIITFGIAIRSIVKIMSNTPKRKLGFPLFKKKETPEDMTPEKIAEILKE